MEGATAAGFILVAAITMNDGSGAILMDKRTGTFPVFPTMEECTEQLTPIKEQVLADTNVNKDETILECRPDKG